MIGGHRDTHFGFLRNLVAGDELLVQTAEGHQVRYQVRLAEVVDSERQPLTIDPQHRGLLLVTCFPFETLDTGGPLRYLVWAEEIPPVTYSL